MYENEFNAALQAIAESVNEDEFDAIVEGAAILIDEQGLAMDEAVGTAAAMLYNEDAIGDNAFAVTNAVIDEFANSPVSYEDVISVLAESMSEEAFSAFMTEAVGAQLNKINESQLTPEEKERVLAKLSTQKGLAGKEKKAMAKKFLQHASDDVADPAAKAKQAAVAGHMKARQAAQKQAKQGAFNSGYAQGAKAGGAAGERKGYAAGNKAGMVKGAALGVTGAAALAGGIYAGKKLYDKVQAKKAEKAAEEAKLSNRVKAGELVDKAKDKIAPKNEDASEVFTLKDLRAIAESVQTTEEQ